MSDDNVPDIALTEADRDLVRKVAFGADVERFVESDFGQYLFAKANDLEAECDIALRTVDPTNLRDIVRLQVRAQAAGYLKDFLEEAVRVGIEAHKELSDQEE